MIKLFKLKKVRTKLIRLCSKLQNIGNGYVEVHISQGLCHIGCGWVSFVVQYLRMVDKVLLWSILVKYLY